MRSKFALKLKSIMEKQGISQGELSRRTGLSQPYISELQRGLKAPSFEVAQKLTEGLKCSLDDLSTSGQMRNAG